MYSLDELYGELNKVAPIELSYKCIEQGDYDNSGILIRNGDTVNGVLFSLDLSLASVKEAKKHKCNTIVTHHPAIYTPLKALRTDDVVNACVLSAAKAGLNVVSMHLNLDCASKGIDYYLAKGLGAESYKNLTALDDKNGYGKEFSVSVTLSEFVKNIKKEFRTNKIICYGKGNIKIKTVASFCGGGASYAEDLLKSGKLTADTVVTSDMPHHVIKEFVESGKNVVLLTHYACENYGFNKVFTDVAEKIKSKTGIFYFEDKRFM